MQPYIVYAGRVILGYGETPEEARQKCEDFLREKGVRLLKEAPENVGDEDGITKPRIGWMLERDLSHAPATTALFEKLLECGPGPSVPWSWLDTYPPKACTLDEYVWNRGTDSGPEF